MVAIKLPFDTPTLLDLTSREVRVETSGDDIVFSHLWSNSRCTVTAFSILFGGLLLSLFLISRLFHFSLLEMHSFPLLMTCTGLFIYYLVAHFFNTTVVQAGGGLLCISHHPLPWPTPITLRTSQIMDLGTQDVVLFRGMGRMRPMKCTRLFARLHDGRRITLFSHLCNRNTADELIEKMLPYLT